MPKLLLAGVGAVAVVAGSGILLAGSRWYGRLNRGGAEWHIERVVYRHHGLFGSLIILGALVFLALLALHHTAVFRTGLAGLPRTALLIALIQLASWLFAVMVLAIGVFVALRPSLLKGVEAMANRWVEPLPSAPIRTGRQSRYLAVGLLLAGAACLFAGI